MFTGLANLIKNYKESLPKDCLILKTVIIPDLKLIEIHTNKMIYAIKYKNLRRYYVS